MVRRHAQEQGWELSEEDIFRDDGYSGTTLGRPALDALRDRARLREYEVVVVPSPDRLARNYVRQMVLIEEFEKAGCRVEFVERPMSSEPNDQLLLQIRGAVAEYERTLLSERMRRGRLAKYKAGLLLPWTHVPYGLRVHPDRPRDPAGVKPDEAKAAVVAEIFAAYLEPGASLFGVSRHLPPGDGGAGAQGREGVEHGHPARDTDQPRLRGQGLRRARALPPPRRSVAPQPAP
jgi:site-specific DNA recombinase